jgi:hypothetical protein
VISGRQPRADCVGTDRDWATCSRHVDDPGLAKSALLAADDLPSARWTEPEDPGCVVYANVVVFEPFFVKKALRDCPGVLPFGFRRGNFLDF